jgi:hypothetical protein
VNLNAGCVEPEGGEVELYAVELNMYGLVVKIIAREDNLGSDDFGDDLISWQHTEHVDRSNCCA